ncbi:MAG: hypothetical protein A2808_02255 [Candidatus Moranbacteria bacterium RIFCSPHIGHO2_01_FULL_55_24]|nr:MAG: hypothetical protein A2808_02255 [Candidatus Moranbacteria bacterium RIFCSPHIGHO2_01_FULL_55_24]
MTRKIRSKKYFFVAFTALSSLLLSNFFFVVAKPVQAAEEDTNAIKDNIDEIEAKLKKEEKKQASLQSDLNQINSTLSATQAAIARVQRLLRETESNISSKEQEISLLENQLTLDKHVLKGLLQELYYSHNAPLVEVMLAESDVQDILQTNDSLFSTQEKIQALIGEMSDAKERIAEEKMSLEDTKDDHETLLEVQNRQKQGLVLEKNETASDLEDQAKVVSRLKSELSELQGDLNKLLGKSYNAADIQEAVEFASNKTGVPKGFLFGVLKMETNLGANVGGCTYAQVEDGAQANYKKGKLSKRSWQTFQYRRDIFKKITSELGIDYRKQKVSCNPSGYTGTGGAMGVAQFMPDTWMGYKAQVASVTGHNPPSPWNLTDGVMAMALKLKRVPGVTEGKEAAYRRAAAAYLGTSYAPYINGIIYWSKNYKKLI